MGNVIGKVVNAGRSTRYRIESRVFSGPYSPVENGWSRTVRTKAEALEVYRDWLERAGEPAALPGWNGDARSLRTVVKLTKLAPGGGKIVRHKTVPFRLVR